MKARNTGEPAHDPFAERRRRPPGRRQHLLGAPFTLYGGSDELRQCLSAAFAGLPPQRLPGAPPLRLEVLPGSAPRRGRRGEPPPWLLRSGSGLICAAGPGAAFTAVAPAAHGALVMVPPALLKHPYHVRYELIELAAYLLAARTQGLTPLHAGCVGRADAGVLLIGGSGSGKSTLALHCLLQGLELLAEDSVLVAPGSLLATGLANFLHLREDALRFIAAPAVRRLFERAPRIHRRSGVAKRELDMRRAPLALARRPLQVRAVLFLSAQRAPKGELLTPLRRAELARRLGAQRYAAAQPGWRTCLRRLLELPAFELRRGGHPAEGAAAVHRLLTWR